MRYFTFLLVSLPFVSSAYNPNCRADVVARLGNGTLQPNDSTIFYRNNKGIFESDPNNKITLTLDGCWTECGRGWSPYAVWDIVERLSVWVFPVLLLVGNMHLAPLSAIYSVLTVIHLIGDPIDSTWSLLTKLEVSFRGRQLAINKFENLEAEDVGTLITAKEEVEDTSTDKSTERFVQNIELLLSMNKSSDSFARKLKKTAHQLCDACVYESSRTYLAISAYLVGLVMAFKDALDTGTNVKPPGNRIAYAMMFSWLIPAVLLSAAIGRFVSRRSSEQILRRFRPQFNPPQLPLIRRSSIFGRCVTDDDPHEAQPWDGIIYSYRPQKRVFAVGKGGRSSFLLLVLAIMSVFLSVASAFAISWITPTVGLGCRSLSQLFVGIAWLCSAFITWVMWKLAICKGKYHFWFMLLKDTLIGGATIMLVILVQFGIFNSCWCWSAEYSRHSGAFVELDVDVQRREKAKLEYPALVFGTLFGQLILYLIMKWKDGLNKQVYSRNEKQLESAHRERRGYQVLENTA